MNQLQLFLPCAAGVEDYLAQEVHEITGNVGTALQTLRGGVLVPSKHRTGPGRTLTHQPPPQLPEASARAEAPLAKGLAIEVCTRAPHRNTTQLPAQRKSP